MNFEKIKTYLVRSAIVLPLAIPIIIYPMILIANIMSFAAPVPSDATMIQVAVANGFLWGTTLYPFFVLYMLRRWNKTLTSTPDYTYIYIAYAYLGACVLTFMIWMTV